MRFINTSDLAEPSWRFIEPFCSDDDISWEFHIGRPRNTLERLVPRPNLARWRAAGTAALSARRQDQPSVLVSHLPRIGAATNIFRRAFCPNVPQIAFAFNFTDLPTGTDLVRMRKSLSGIDEFVVFSNFERGLYSRHFGIEETCFRYLPWAMEAPKPGPTHPRPDLDNYFCAIGGEGRDYALLAQAMRKMPETKMIIVARPYSIKGIEFPDNVVVFTNLSAGETWRIASDSAGMVLPLRSGETVCGHITLVGAQLLGLPLVVTRSVGIEDYVRDRENVLLIQSGSSEEIIAAVQELKKNPQLADSLGQAASSIAGRDNSSDAWVSYFDEKATEIKGSRLPR